MLKKLIFLLFALITFASLVAASLYFTLKTWSIRPYGDDSVVAEIIFKLERGTKRRELAQSLEDASVVSSAQLFSLWVRFFSDFQQFQAGRYKFTLPISPEALAAAFIEGNVHMEVTHEVTIPEGFRLDQIIERFVESGIGVRTRFINLAQNPEFLQELGIGARGIEGYLYPATYPFYEKPSEKEVFRVMVQEFWERLPDGYEQKVAVYGLTLHQAITIASLIEAETRVEAEKPKVAEVILNRLNLGMPLGIDAAVIYGIPNFDGNLRRKDLQNKDNPYNLRVKKGLPPTPINTPTESSLEAVISPTNEGYLYYVLDPNSGLEHTFTKSHKEHLKAVKKLVKSKK